MKKAAEDARSEVNRRAREVPPTYKIHNVLPAFLEVESFEAEWDPAKPCFFKKDNVPHLAKF